MAKPRQHASVVSGIFKQPFDEQVAFFRNKMGNLIPTARWDDITREQHDTGFMVAGAQRMDLLADLAASIERVQSEGKSLDAWRKDFRNIVQKNGWHGWKGEGTSKGEAWRTRVIYRTNAATAYAAGREAQLREGGFAFSVYKHSGSENPRLQHLAWDGLTLPADHPFWQTHSPINAFGCECSKVGPRSERGARRLGGDPDKPLPKDWNTIDPKTGTPPGIGKGFDYAPGASVSHIVTALAKKMESWPAPLGAAWWGSDIPVGAQVAHQQAWRSFLANATTNRARPQGKLFTVGAISTATLTALQQNFKKNLPATAEIILRDSDISHLLRDSKQHKLADSWLQNLPQYLRLPTAVLLDTTLASPALLYIITGSDGGKVVVQLNYRLKKSDALVNLLRTGRTLDDQSIRGIKERLGNGYELLEGNL